jgi:NAD(P)-dependent dehydrogenase (short-subunit alcohol dehydrogenase family)|tara:strand:+ start:491 stop:1279 length:789 start_codon:yes stop_codon:yes gene_type:complete
MSRVVHGFDLSGLVILITGGYGHLGKACVDSLVHHGANVYVLARSSEKFLQAFPDCDDIAVTFFSCDISKTSDLKYAFKSIFQKEGKIDVLINNAFYCKGTCPETLSDSEWSIGIEGVVGSAFRAMREVIPFFKGQNNGRIINISSIYGLRSPDFNIYKNFPLHRNPPHYGAAKAALLQLTKYYACILGPHGITVNALTPGAFPSSDVHKDVGFIKELESKTALNRVGRPEDLAGGVIFLSSSAGNYITGQNIIIDGGWTAK